MAGTNKSGGQTNWYQGRNTAYFHLQYPLPDLAAVKVDSTSLDCNDLTPFDGQLPYPQLTNSTGGTPNQKAERVANQIAYSFFTHPDPKTVPEVYKTAVTFFDNQASFNGHQCIGRADEVLTASHGPIVARPGEPADHQLGDRQRQSLLVHRRRPRTARPRLDPVAPGARPARRDPGRPAEVEGAPAGRPLGREPDALSQPLPKEAVPDAQPGAALSPGGVDDRSGQQRHLSAPQDGEGRRRALAAREEILGPRPVQP